MGLRSSVEMSISREEFFRLLPAAVGPFVVEGDTIRPADGNPGWLIRLVPLGDVRVGSLVVPRHQVEIDLEARSEEEAEVFIHGFHRGFLRGGG